MAYGRIVYVVLWKSHRPLPLAAVTATKKTLLLNSFNLLQQVGRPIINLVEKG